MKQNLETQQNQHTHHTHSHHHRHKHRSHRKRYSQERQSYNKSELIFMLKCTVFVVVLMMILIPLFAHLTSMN